MTFDLAIIDLDNTLYASISGVFEAMDRRITSFIVHNLAIDEERADDLRIRYWKQYGSTLHGLMLHHSIEAESFLHDIHKIDIETKLRPDAMLHASLDAMPWRKVIHTNGTREHAERVLAALDVRRHFDAIYDIRFNQYRPKSCADTLDMLLSAENTRPARTIVIDDMADNLAAAAALGARTAWISDAHSELWHHCAPTLPALVRSIGAD